MTRKIYKIGLLEDDPVIRDYLEDILGEAERFDVAFSVALLRDAKQAYARNPQTDLCLIDLDLPDGNGTEFIRSLNWGSTKSLVLTVLGDRTSVITAFEAGAHGYLIKDSDEMEILTSCEQTIEGLSPVSPAAAVHLLKLFKQNEPEQANPENSLSEREIEILTLFAKGLSYSEVATMLELSWHTINGHTKTIYSKLNVHSKNEAIFEALQFGWIKV